MGIPVCIHLRRRTFLPVSEATTTLLYALSTLAQTCAALAAFVGAVGVYRLQFLRNEHARNEQTIRGILFHLLDRQAQMMPLDQLLQAARNHVADPKSLLPASGRDGLARALTEREGFPNQRWRMTRALYFFEGWNLLVIGLSLVGFNHISVLASSPWTFWALWPVAIITAVVTVRSVVAWTSE